MKTEGQQQAAEFINHPQKEKIDDKEDTTGKSEHQHQTYGEVRNATGKATVEHAAITHDSSSFVTIGTIVEGKNRNNNTKEYDDGPPHSPNEKVPIWLLPPDSITFGRFELTLMSTVVSHVGSRAIQRREDCSCCSRLVRNRAQS